MQNIVICGDSGDRKLTEIIIKACTENGGVIVSDRGKMYATCSEPKFCILTEIEKMSCKGIAVLGSNAENTEIGSDVIAVVESDNTKALEMLQREGCQNAVTCSMNRHSTLSMSCVYPEKIAVLQRSVKNLHGRVSEPCEFRIISDEEEIYPILAAGAVMLLSDNEIREEYHIC